MVMSEVLDGVGRSSPHLLMPSIGMATESWKTERSASQPLSPMLPSPFPPSPTPSPNAQPEPRNTNHITPSYSLPPATFSLPSATTSVERGVVHSEELSLIHHFIRNQDGRRTPLNARSIDFSSDSSSSDDHPLPPPSPPPNPVWPTPTPHSIPISALLSLTFNCFDYSEEQLLLCTVHTLDHLNLISSMQLSLPALQQFLLHIRAKYRRNPYHNFFHGFAVFQFGFFMLTSSKLLRLLSPQDQLALLIACLCHDVDHPGTTNSFQIAVESELARAHNDVAVLENHHAFVTREMLRQSATNFLPTFTAVQMRAFRHVITQAILATDMAVHFELCRQFARFDSDLDKYDGRREDDRQLVINVVTHSSDLSAQVMDFSIASLWETRVTAEFIAQSELESERGIPVSTFMNGLHEHAVRYKNHLNFLDFVMQPLWSVVSDVLPPMQTCLDSLRSNRQSYQHRLTHNTPQRAAEAVAAATAAEERRPLTNSVAPSSSSPSSTAVSLAVSVAASPSASPPITAPHSPLSVSPQRGLHGHSHDSAASSPSLPGSPSEAYHALPEDDNNNSSDAADAKDNGQLLQLHTRRA